MGDECAGLVRVQARHKQVPLRIHLVHPRPIRVILFRGRMRSQEGIQHPTPPLYEPAIIQNVLPAMIDAPREKVLALRPRKQADDELDAGPLAVLDEVFDKGGAYVADGTCRAARQAQEREIARRVGLGHKQGGVVGGCVEKDFETQDEDLSSGWWSWLLFSKCCCVFVFAGQVRRQGQEVLLAVCSVGSLVGRRGEEGVGLLGRRGEVVYAEEVVLGEDGGETVGDRRRGSGGSWKGRW